MAIFGGSSQNTLYLGVISMHFWVIFKVKVQNGGIFFWGGGAKISNILWGS